MFLYPNHYSSKNFIIFANSNCYHFALYPVADNSFMKRGVALYRKNILLLAFSLNYV